MSLDHLALLTGDLEAFVVAVQHGPADAPVAGCPGWTLEALGEHLGEVHRWVLGALATGAPPTPNTDTAPMGDLDALAAWLRGGSARLIATLAATDPGSPTWHPFPAVPKVAGVWRRRQAHEASVHRWDAERAAGGRPTIEREFAADGVDEYWTVMLPRMIGRERRRTPASTLAVQLTDIDVRWVVDGSSGAPVVGAADSPAAELRGDAQSVLLRLWGRPTDNPIDISGDAAVAEEWLALGGA